eukprot:157646-Chlamydomonas_euryale.AAC.2
MTCADAALEKGLLGGSPRHRRRLLIGPRRSTCGRGCRLLPDGPDGRSRLSWQHSAVGPITWRAKLSAVSAAQPQPSCRFVLDEKGGAAASPAPCESTTVCRPMSRPGRRDDVVRA